LHCPPGEVRHPKSAALQTATYSAQGLANVLF
jgi:hypothetical protein